MLVLPHGGSAPVFFKCVFKVNLFVNVLVLPHSGLSEREGGMGGGRERERERSYRVRIQHGGAVGLRHDFEIQERGEKVNPVTEV